MFPGIIVSRNSYPSNVLPLTFLSISIPSHQTCLKNSVWKYSIEEFSLSFPLWNQPSHQAQESPFRPASSFSLQMPQTWLLMGDSPTSQYPWRTASLWHCAAGTGCDLWPEELSILHWDLPMNTNLPIPLSVYKCPICPRKESHHCQLEGTWPGDGAAALVRPAGDGRAPFSALPSPFCP